VVEQRPRPRTLDPILFTLGRRFDEAVYGAGLWGVPSEPDRRALLPQRPSRAPVVPPFVSEPPRTALTEQPGSRSEEGSLTVVRGLGSIL
jgi:hypothetical protein